MNTEITQHNTETAEQWQHRFRTQTLGLLRELHDRDCMLDDCFCLGLLTPAQFMIAGPILLRHLRLPYPNDVLFVLSIPFTRSVALPFRSELIALYTERGAIHGTARDNIGFGIASTTKLRNIRETMAIVADTNQPGRVPVLSGLRRYRNRPEVAEFLATIRADSELKAELKQWKK